MKVNCSTVTYFESQNKEIDLLNAEAAKEHEVDSKIMTPLSFN
jgi:hypothetical protein